MPTSAPAPTPVTGKCRKQVGARGVFVGRAPVDYHDFHMQQAMPAFRDACAGIKAALDPNGVIAPGRYGIAGKRAAAN